MRESLEAVRGAVDKKDLVPVLSHFAFKDGRVYGYNGRVLISAPINDKALAFTVPAKKFLAAFDAVEDMPQPIVLKHKEDRVLLTCGAFKVSLPAGPIEEFPVVPEPKKRVPVTAPILDKLRHLRAFIGEDASRPWSAALRFGGGKIVATNNVVLAVVGNPRGFPVTDAVVPVQGVEELLRLDAEPTHVAIEESAIVFWFAEGVVLRSVLLHDTWPDTQSILTDAFLDAKMRKVNVEALRRAVAQVRPFCPDGGGENVVLEGATVATLQGETFAEVKGFKFPVKMVFQIEPLLQVLELAETLDWDRYPRLPWASKDGWVKGVLAGRRS